MSVLFISHDLPLVSEIADNVIVIYEGAIIEQGKTKDIFRTHQKQYTKGLINSKPSLSKRFKKLPTVSDFIEKNTFPEIYSTLERNQFHQKLYDAKPLLEIVNLKKYFESRKGFSKNTTIKAVDDVSFKLYEGETLGLVGESGCGKTTLGRSILHLEEITSGKIFYKGKDITVLSKP